MYIPLIRPDPASDKRQLAYHEGTPVPGPEDDPEGWKVLGPFTMSGSILNERKVEVTGKVWRQPSTVLLSTDRVPIACAGQTRKLDANLDIQNLFLSAITLALLHKRIAHTLYLDLGRFGRARP